MKHPAAALPALLAFLLAPGPALPAQADAQPAAMHAASQAPSRAAVQPEPGARRLLVMLRLPPPHFRPDSGYAGGYSDDGGRAARRRIARELADSHGLTLVNDWPMPVIGVDCFVMEDHGAAPLDSVLGELARDPRVAWAQAVNLFQGLGGLQQPRDPLYPAQPAARAWRLAELHRVSTGSRVAVAVIDSGVDDAHPDLAGQVALRRNFVDAPPDAAEAHGTAVAGIIAARAGNGVGIAGVAPEARLLALRACWEKSDKEEVRSTRCDSLTLGKALQFALLNDARIVNLSLGGPPDRLLASLIDAALARGVAVVGAADPLRADGGFPASHPGVIAVTVAGDRRALPALRAPGADIPTSLPGARWALVSGSSYAAAHVAGLAALVAALRPAITPAQLRQALRETGGAGPATVAYGGPTQDTGSMDACAILARAAGACVCLCHSTAAATAELSR